MKVWRDEKPYKGGGIVSGTAVEWLPRKHIHRNRQVYIEIFQSVATLG